MNTKRKLVLAILVLSLQVRTCYTIFRSVLLIRNPAVIPPLKTAVNIISVSGCKFTCTSTHCKVFETAGDLSLCRTFLHFLGEKLYYFQTKDVETTTPLYFDCAEIYHRGKRTSGVYTIYPQGGAGVKAYCDMVTDGGGWTVFQRRHNGEVDFNRVWEEYAQGFGDPEDGDYWLGLRNVHALTQAQPSVLYVGVTDFEVGAKYAKYGIFNVSSEAEKFLLTVGSYSGTAGDSLSYHSGQKFSTKDQDNDASATTDCSAEKKGAWWFKYCYFAYLNGQFSSTEIYNVEEANSWYAIRQDWYSLKDTFMMLRPASFKP